MEIQVGLFCFVLNLQVFFFFVPTPWVKLGPIEWKALGPATYCTATRYNALLNIFTLCGLRLHTSMHSVHRHTVLWLEGSSCPALSVNVWTLIGAWFYVLTYIGANAKSKCGVTLTDCKDLILKLRTTVTWRLLCIWTLFHHVTAVPDVFSANASTEPFSFSFLQHNSFAFKAHTNITTVGWPKCFKWKGGSQFFLLM